MPLRARSFRRAMVAVCAAAVSLQAQATTRPFTRSDAIAAALANGPRLASARALAAVAAAGLTVARTYPNPALTAEYTRDAPQRHVLLEVPLDAPWLRSSRINSANELREASLHLLAFERAAAELDADTAYTRALWAGARLALSSANATAADSLLRFARARLDAGDVAELDVQLAVVAAGQQANLAAADSLEFTSRLLDLQGVLGMTGDGVRIALADSLAEPDTMPLTRPTGTPLRVAAARRLERSADFAVQFERANVWAMPSLTAGIENHDPSGDAGGALPVLGLTIPLPLFNRNRGGIALAEAERERARAELRLAEVEGAIELERARRDATSTRSRLVRDAALLQSAQRVAALSLTAYREGAATIAAVLEAQRSARDVRAQYLDDLAAAAIAAARVRALSLTAP